VTLAGKALHGPGPKTVLEVGPPGPEEPAEVEESPDEVFENKDSLGADI